MAEEESKLKKKRRKTANPTRVRKAGAKPSAKPKKAPEEKTVLDLEYDELDLSGPDDEEVDGLEKFRMSMSRLVAKRSAALAKTLGKRAELGDVASAKLALGLVRNAKQAKKGSSKGLLELLTTLECEPEWSKPEAREAEKTGRKI